MVSKTRYTYSIALCMWLLVAANPSLAETSEAAKPVTVSDLDAIMQQEILYRAKVARAKQHAELSKYPDSAEDALRQTTDIPQIAWRRATAGGWMAKFVFKDGSSVIASPGEPLPGGMQVAQINERGVKLRRDGALIELTAATNTTGSNPQNDPTHRAATLSGTGPMGMFPPSSM